VSYGMVVCFNVYRLARENLSHTNVNVISLLEKYFSWWMNNFNKDKF